MDDYQSIINPIVAIESFDNSLPRGRVINDRFMNHRNEGRLIRVGGGVSRFDVGRRVLSRVSRVSQGRNSALLQFALSTTASERNNASRLASFLSRADIGRIDPPTLLHCGSFVSFRFVVHTGELRVPRADCTPGDNTHR